MILDCGFWICIAYDIGRVYGRSGVDQAGKNILTEKKCVKYTIEFNKIYPDILMT